GAEPRNVRPLETDAAGRGAQEPRDAVEHRRLPGSVGADDAEDLPRPYGKRHVGDGDQAAEAHGEVLDPEGGAARHGQRCGRYGHGLSRWRAHYSTVGAVSAATPAATRAAERATARRSICPILLGHSPCGRQTINTLRPIP